MAYTFNEEFLSNLRMRCDIENIISRYVELKHSGNNYVGLCPFHSERTPSFSVNPQMQRYKCFGCQEGGDVITFIMKIENLSFIDAVTFLADIAGLTVPKKDFLDTEISELRKKILEMNVDAARFYNNYLNLPEGIKGLNYLSERRLTPSTIKKFGLGYSPDKWDGLLTHLLSRGYKTSDMLAAGLIKRGEKGNYYDVFRAKPMFPIIDHSGKVIGFGGRNLSDIGSKYINTAETMVFKKREAIYAINLAKKNTQNGFILCEGYMDVISLHQAGYTNAVASLGTAFTERQALRIKNFTDTVYVCFDSDSAGKNATMKSIDTLAGVGLNIKIVSLSGGKDPDELLKTDEGNALFKRMLDNSSNSMNYKIEITKKKYNLAIESEKTYCLKELTEILANIKSPVEQAIYTDKVAAEMGIPIKAIMSEINVFKRRVRSKTEKDRKKQLIRDIQSVNNKVNTQRQKYLKAAKIEEDIISLLLSYPEKIEEVKAKIKEEDFVTDFNRRVFVAVLEKTQAYPTGEHLNMLSSLFEPGEISYISSFIAQTQALEVLPSSINTLASSLKEERENILDKGFTTDESFEAQIKKLREKRHGTE